MSSVLESVQDSQNSASKLRPSLARMTQACMFSLGSERFALATSLLQEVVRDIVVEAIPLTPSEILGVFNLRGTPTVLLDTETLLRQTQSTELARTTALVIKDDELRVALAVDRVDGVVSLTAEEIMQVPAGSMQYCEGFVELPAQPGLVAVISIDQLLQRIRTLQVSNIRIAT
jgi:chemotaxis signal transduction protein